MSKGIRRMTVNDAAGVHAVELESFATPWTLDAFEAEMTQNPNAYYVVADQDGIVGFAGLWHIADEGHITNIAVKQSHRGQGLGEDLLTALIAVGRALDLRAMTLEVRVSNTPARTLYEKLGFHYVGIRNRIELRRNGGCRRSWRNQRLIECRLVSN